MSASATLLRSKVKRSGCSCGCVGAHEVARRVLADRATLVIRTDVLRLFLPGAMSPAMTAEHDGHTSERVRWYLGWSSIYTAREVSDRMVQDFMACPR